METTRVRVVHHLKAQGRARRKVDGRRKISSSAWRYIVRTGAMSEKIAPAVAALRTRKALIAINQGDLGRFDKFISMP